jgi:pimeloyl-ACP methyl ester carboxylesterase
MAYARNGSCEIYYDTFGSASDPAFVLVNGLGSQCINYHEDWCSRFVRAGFFVIRFDNRDAGLSTSFENAPVGANGAAYLLSDMALDVVGVLDALGVAKAHVLGLSMGGMVAQTLAIEHADRLLSVTSVMSTTGESEFGQSTPSALALLVGPTAVDRESYVHAWIEGLREWGSPEFANETRWLADAQRAFDRSFNPSGTGRQFLAVRASGSRAAGLRNVRVPMLVLHGDKDTLIDQSGGRRTAELVPGARFVLIEGMGHDYPPELWDRWVAELSGFVASF